VVCSMLTTGARRLALALMQCLVDHHEVYNRAQHHDCHTLLSCSVFVAISAFGFVLMIMRIIKYSYRVLA